MELWLTSESSDSVLRLPVNGEDWFKGTPWTNLPADVISQLVPAEPPRPRVKLLGGSSKLAKLAEERRKKAATTQPAPPVPLDSVSSLDRLSKSKDAKENRQPSTQAEPKKYPIRRKRSPTPPPREPTPPPPEPDEELPDLRSSPTAFGRTLSEGSEQSKGPKRMSLQDLFGSKYDYGPFEGPSPDDAVIRARQGSTGLNK